MKKVLFAIVCLFSFSAQSFADRPVDFSQLPANAQEFIKRHFANVKVSYAMQDNDLFDRDYTVVLANGDNLEFSRKGEWKELNCGRNAVPATVIPEAIKKYVSEKHSGHRVIELKIDGRHYDVKLSNKLELEFSLKGKLLRFD